MYPNYFVVLYPIHQLVWSIYWGTEKKVYPKGAHFPMGSERQVLSEKTERRLAFAVDESLTEAVLKWENTVESGHFIIDIYSAFVHTYIHILID